MHNFNYFTPTKVVFGKDTESQVGQLISEKGCKKVLIHYGGGSVQRSGLLDKVKASLEAKNIAYVELGGVVPNPRLSLVYEGAELAKKEGVDFILAVGGGSVIDSSKGIGYAVVNEGDVWDFYEKTRVSEGCLPIGCILTIAAAGSEMSSSSVLTKDETGVKVGYNSDASRCVFSILNPELTMTLPDYQTACGCVDIVMHTLERYFVLGETMDLTDGVAEALLCNTIKYSKVLVKEPNNYEARAEIMWAGSLSHNGLTGCGVLGGGDWATHALEHELSALYDVAHGAGLAAVWASWAREVYKECLDRFYNIAIRVMKVEDTGNKEEVALKGIEAMEGFFAEINMPIGLKTLGVNPSDEDIKSMAEKCLVNKQGAVGSVKKLTVDEMVSIYKAAQDK